MSFNPRLTSAARRTARACASGSQADVSIRASLQQRGERARANEEIGRYQVSIRASLQQRGEPPTRLPIPARAAFQSAPHFSSEANEIRIRDESRQARFNPRLTSAARRTRRHVEVDRRTCVSIRASLQQRGEPGYGRPDASRTGFQSAPHFSSEANAGTREPYRRVRSFNPRLTSAARRTGTANEIAITNGVSIRASLQQRGEHAGKSPLNFSSSAFQSAPHFSSEANGSIISTSRRSRSFQSAPHFSSEANRTGPWHYRSGRWFQSAPHFSSEANAQAQAR